MNFSNRDLISSALQGSSVFKDRSKLSPDYIPPKLPHRELKLRELGLAFRPLIQAPGSSSIRVVLAGKTGVGKTATAKSFGREIKEIARGMGLKLEYIHVNCHRHRTLYLLTLELANSLRLPLPNRGLSSQEIFQAVHEYFDKRGINAIITLDEFDYFLNTSPYEDVYFLVRLYDEINSQVKRIHYVFIVRDKTSLDLVDKSVRDHIVRQIIEFEPYTSLELFDILSDRANESFKQGVVEEGVLKFISDIHGADKGGSGNARVAIETLEVAGDLADKDYSNVITVEHAKVANTKVNPEMTSVFENLGNLDLVQLLLLKSLIRLLRRFKVDKVTMGQLEEEYRQLSLDLGEEPRRHTQIYESIRRMRFLGILDTSQSGKGMRGRTTLISLKVPVTDELERMVDSNIMTGNQPRG